MRLDKVISKGGSLTLSEIGKAVDDVFLGERLEAAEAPHRVPAAPLGPRRLARRRVAAVARGAEAERFLRGGMFVPWSTARGYLRCFWGCG